MSFKFQTLLDIVDTAIDRNTFAHALSSFAADLGFEHFAYLSLERERVNYFGDYPQPWEKLYLRQRLDRQDPVIARAKHCAGTFSWSAADWVTSSNSGAKFFAISAIEHGIGHGVTISARASFDTQLVLSLASRDRRRQPTSHNASDAIPLLMGLHYRLTPILGGRGCSTVSPLSSREILCLKWAAMGKTAPETAIITGLSPRTVQHYLDAARGKLNASTVTHLVAISKDLKVI